MTPSPPRSWPPRKKRGWAAPSDRRGAATSEARTQAGVPVASARRGGAGPEREWRSRGTRLAGLAAAPSRKRRPFPLDRERPPTTPPRSRAASVYSPAGGPPALQIQYSATSRTDRRRRTGLSRPGRGMASGSKTGRAARPRGGVPRGRYQAPHPVRSHSDPAVCVVSPAPPGSATADPRQSDRHREAETRPGLGGEGLARAIERRSRGQPPARGAPFVRSTASIERAYQRIRPPKNPNFRPPSVDGKRCLLPCLPPPCIAPSTDVAPVAWRTGRAIRYVC